MGKPGNDGRPADRRRLAAMRAESGPSHAGRCGAAHTAAGVRSTGAPPRCWIGLPRRGRRVTALLVSPDAPTVVLVDATSEAERRLVEDALTGVGDRPVTVLPLRGEALAGPLRRRRPEHGRDRGPGGLGAPPAGATRSRAPAGGAWSTAAPSLPRRPPRPLQTAALRRDPGARPRRRRRAGHRRRARRPLGRCRLAVRLRGAPGRAGARPRRARSSSARGSRCPGTSPRRSRTAPSSGARSRRWPSGSSCPRRRSTPTRSPTSSGLVAAMDPVAVELFTGAFRPLHA